MRLKTLRWKMSPLPPFRIDLTVWALRRRPSNLIDRWDGEVYERVLTCEGKPIEILVSQTGPMDRPVLDVEANGPELDGSAREQISVTLEKMLGMQVDLTPFQIFARKDDLLKSIVDRFQGFKPPRFPTLFEALANGIACQQVSLAAGIQILGRIASRFGQSLEGNHGFPEPQALAVLDEETLRQTGLSRQKAKALIFAAQAALQGGLDEDLLATLTNEQAAEHLRLLPGVGPWTAEYILLRGLGRQDVFPTNDSGALKSLRKWLPEIEAPSALPSTPADRWRPFGGLIYLHLLLLKLAEQGHLD